MISPSLKYHWYSKGAYSAAVITIVDNLTSVSYFFRYVPTDWALKTELTLDEVSELNTMNIELAGLLGKKNPAFTPFQHGNFSCIMIKEVSIVNIILLCSS